MTIWARKNIVLPFNEVLLRHMLIILILSCFFEALHLQYVAQF